MRPFLLGSTVALCLLILIPAAFAIHLVMQENQREDALYYATKEVMSQGMHKETYTELLNGDSLQYRDSNGLAELTLAPLTIKGRLLGIQANGRIGTHQFTRPILFTRNKEEPAARVDGVWVTPKGILRDREWQGRLVRAHWDALMEFQDEGLDYARNLAIAVQRSQKREEHRKDFLAYAVAAFESPETATPPPEAPQLPEQTEKKPFLRLPRLLFHD